MQAERSRLLEDASLTGAAWCAAHAALVDEWLHGLLRDAAGAGATGLALVAVGGYGRAELCPGSDIDVMLLHDRFAGIAAVADRIWYPLWDAGFHVGHSVATPDEALQVAAGDLDTATALLACRHIGGDAALTQHLAARARRQWQRQDKRWLGELAASVAGRHEVAGSVAFLLEPDLKQGRGGLRDVHALHWAEATGIELLDKEDDADLQEAYGVLLDGRVELQRRTGRTTDVLVLEEQAGVAAALGDADAEALMTRIAAAASRIAWASDESWRHARARLEGPLRRITGRSRTLAPGITLHEGAVRLDQGDRGPVDALLPLRIAALAAANGAVVERRTLQRLSNAAPLPEPWPDEARLLLVDLLRCGPPAVAVIEGLDQRKVWTAVLPEWAEVRSRAQHNAYHRYTVDRHLLETAAIAAQLAGRTERDDLLVMAALLHDIGKGRSCDHTELGMELTAAIATRMGFAPADVETLVHLVRHHLLLSEVATRRDIDDPATISAVAEAVGTGPVLRLLAALTEADSRATGPAVWGAWKRELLALLVDRVAAVLDGEDPARAGPRRRPSVDQQALLEGTGTTIAAEGDVVTVVSDDRPGLFSRVAGVLALHGLDVLAASAHSSDRGRALSEFRVVDPMRDETPWDRVIADLHRALDGKLALNARVAERARTYGRSRLAFSRLAVAAVSFDNAASPGATVIDVHAPDSIGLLYRITRALAELDLDIRSARAETVGAQVVDSFYVRDRGGTKITDPDALREIERAILHSVDGPHRP